MKENEYKFKTPVLCQTLGITRQTLIRWEKLGRFVAPRTMGNARTFTEKQIKEIKKAFMPGGKGHWFFKNET